MTTLLRRLASLLVLPVLAFAVEPELNSPAAPAAEELVSTKPQKHVVVMPRGGLPLEEPTLRLNFRGAPLETVLSYLSEAAGYTVMIQAPVSGTLDAWNGQLLTRSEALEVLNAGLTKNGLTAIQDGKTLTVLRTSEAKRGNLPIRMGGRSETIPKNDQLVTQIMPLHFLTASQLIRDLQPILPASANVATSEGGNSILITDSQVNIRRFAEIVQALDTSSAAAAHLRLFPLRYADSKSVAVLIKELFTSDSSRTPQDAGTGFGGGGPPGPNADRAPASESGARTSAAGKVLAVADERSNAVIVTAPDELMGTIEELVNKMDTDVEDITELRLFRLKNSDPNEIVELVGNLFPDRTKSDNNTGSTFGSPFGGGPGGQPPGVGDAGAAGDANGRAKKQGTVVVVPDPRSKSVIVKASHELMRQVEKTILDLDADSKGKQKVYVYSINNADSLQVQQVLQDLFASSTGSRSAGNSSQTSALAQRAQRSTGTSGSGTSTAGGSGRAGAASSGSGGASGASAGR